MKTVLAVSLLALSAAAAPHRPGSGGHHRSSEGQQAFSFPLSDGFPNIASGSAALKEIERLAHGTLPNGALPSHISNVSAATWQLIAFNELFEVAYFTSLINNVTNEVPGYEIGSPAARNIILNTLETVRAQEELHALGANGILQTAGDATISPCEYIFPVADFDSAIGFASTFTDLVLGTLQSALTNFLAGGDGADFLQLVGSVIGQEGEQNGIYRAISMGNAPPSSQPFLTASSGAFALSALHQMVVVPGSCPDTIPIPVFKPLSILTTSISPETETIQFSFNTGGVSYNTGTLSLVYINGQNAPVVEKLTGLQSTGNTVTFTAPFPYSEFQMDGFTIAAITDNAGPFANADAVASATIFGPGLIEVV